MALAFGALSSLTSSSSGGSVSVSGSNPIGIVFGYGQVGVDSWTSVTWGGVSMTKIAGVVLGGDRGFSVWYIISPIGGASTISITGGTDFGFYSTYYTGARQSGQVDSFNTGTSTSSTSLTIATTVVSSGSWLVFVHKDATGAVVSTNLGVMRLTNDGAGMAMADSNGTVGTGSQSMTLNTVASQNSEGILFSIAALGAVATNSQYRALLGVGI